MPQKAQGPESQHTFALCSDKISLPAVAPELLAQSRIMARILVQAENHQSGAEVLGKHAYIGPNTTRYEKVCRAIVVLYSWTQTHCCQNRNAPALV